MNRRTGGLVVAGVLVFAIAPATTALASAPAPVTMPAAAAAPAPVTAPATMPAAVMMPAAVTMPSSAAARSMPHIEIGVPGEDVGGQVNAGAVEVRYSSGTTKQLVSPNPQAGDQFGTAFAADDINLDFREDLFVGAPGRDVGGKLDAGAVYVFLGTPNGLTYWKTITMDSPRVEGSAQAGAGFGASLFANEEISSSYLPIGVPGYDVGDAEDAGAVVHVEVGYDDDPTWTGRLLTEANWSGQVPESGDRFGASVVTRGSDLVIGAPGETVDGNRSAGAVFGHVPAAAEFATVLTQDTPDMPGAAEPGDRFGRALALTPDRLYVGIPGEDVGSRADAGLVGTARIPDSIDQSLVPGPSFGQNSVDETTGLPLAGSAEPGDRFGAAIGAHGPEAYDPGELQRPIYVGVPGEDVGSVRDAGMLNVLHDADQPGLTDGSVGGRSEAGDEFGAAVYARIGWNDTADTNTVVVGVPGENEGAGAVRVLVPNRLVWWQITGAREAGDGYGASISGSL